MEGAVVPSEGQPPQEPMALKKEPVALPESLAWAVLIGVQDPALISGWLAFCPRLLVVQPNELLLERLLEFWHGSPPSGVEISSVLPAAESADIPWYTYNDGRLDGLTDPDTLRHAFPNLVLHDQQFRAGTPLQQLLLDWWQRSGDPGGTGVLLHWGDGFEAVLWGAGALIDRFERLQHHGLSHDVIPVAGGSGAATAPLAQWLASCCFTPLPATSGVVSGWQRDRQRLLQRQCERLQAEQELLLGQRQSWGLQREQLQRAFELVHQRLDALAAAQVPRPQGQGVDALLGSWEDWQG